GYLVPVSIFECICHRVIVFTFSICPFLPAVNGSFCPIYSASDRQFAGTCRWPAWQAGIATVARLINKLDQA
ncbi:MAG TPA: hypothetical protein VIW27_09655, partial [Gammaproteobacteria bacterium]